MKQNIIIQLDGFTRKPFNQSDFINQIMTWRSQGEDFEPLNHFGVCSGLCIDYARHIINHSKNNQVAADYVAKLNRKFNKSPKIPKNFVMRISDYQERSYFLENAATQNDLLTPLKEGIFVDALNEYFKQKDVLYLRFRGTSSGHAIALSFKRNNKQEIISYRIFDPNFGEIEIQDKDKFNKLLKALSENYPMTSCNVLDIEQYLNENGFVKNTNYKKEDKYILQIQANQKNISHLLLHAAERGDIEFLKRILAQGADVNIRTLDHYTPLHIACENGYKDTVKVLLENGANIEAVTNEGVTPLYITCQLGLKDIAALLLEHNPNIETTVGGTPPLYAACYFKQVDIVKLLIKHGANLEASKFGITPLFKACNSGYTEIVEILLKNKASKDILIKGVTPLHAACAAGHKDTISLLLKYNVDIHIKDKNNKTALDLCSDKLLEDVAKSIIQKKPKENSSIISNLIKQPTNHLQDTTKAWKLAELIVNTCNEKDRVQIVSTSLKLIQTSYRRDRVLNFLPAKEKAMVSVNLDPVLQKNSTKMNRSKSRENIVPQTNFTNSKTRSFR